jgi:hypothetical protein
LAADQDVDVEFLRIHRSRIAFWSWEDRVGIGDA